MSSRLTKTAAMIAVVFGTLTVISGGRALFGGADMGAVVPFVLRFNFVAGFAYVIAGYGLWRRASWARFAAIVIFTSTAFVFAAFLVQVLRGVPWEERTMGAMILRTLVWAWIAKMA
jgi:hypothetical protein